MSSRLTKVLVLSGAVELGVSIGLVGGARGDTLLDAADPSPSKVVVEANTDFALDLYQQLAEENAGENLFFSPYSVSGALAMTIEGARHETAAEMGRVLRFPDAARRTGDDAQRIPWRTSLIHSGMAELNERLMGEKDPAETAAIGARMDALRKQLAAAKARAQQQLAVAQARAQHLREGRKWQEFHAAQQREQKIAAALNELSARIDQYEIRVANALWGEKTYPFHPEYVKTIGEYYKTGGIFPVDFRRAFEDARLKINAWVEEQTNHRIKDLIPAGALDEYTRLVLTNAIYFKGEWATPLEQKHTTNREFTLADGTKVQTPIMYAPKLKVARYGAFNPDGSFFDTPMRIRDGQDPKQSS